MSSTSPQGSQSGQTSVDLPVNSAQNGATAHQVVSSSTRHGVRQLTYYRLVVKASEDVQQGRYYNETLEELDQSSLVRDRGVPRPADQEEEAEEEEEEPVEDELDEPEEPEEDPRPRAEPEEPKSGRQQALEAEWGLHRSPALSQQSPEEDDGDTDDGRNHDSPDLDEEDFVVSCAARTMRGSS